MNYLLAYPKSGNFWTRYIIERITGGKCLGVGDEKKQDSAIQSACINDYDANAPIFLRNAHYFFLLPKLNKDDHLLLLVRDYKECIPGYLYANFAEEKDVEPDMVSFFAREDAQKVIKEQMLVYMDNIKFFHEQTCEKEYLFYEKLVNDAVTQIYEYQKFFKLDPRATYFFACKQHEEEEKSFNYKKGRPLKTRSNRELSFYKQFLPESLIRELDQIAGDEIVCQGYKEE